MKPIKKDEKGNGNSLCLPLKHKAPANRHKTGADAGFLNFRSKNMIRLRKKNAQKPLAVLLALSMVLSGLSQTVLTAFAESEQIRAGFVFPSSGSEGGIMESPENMNWWGFDDGTP